MARKLGGAMGSVAIGFQLVEGEPRVEVHDTRWVNPDFKDRISLTLRSLEKRWIYTVEERVPDGKGGTKWVDVPYWYRRIIDEEKDIVFLPVPVGQGDEPEWEIDEEKSVIHNLGFCPVVWVQNHEAMDDIDGEPDCHGAYDQLEQRDFLLSMAVRGVGHNCDPTGVITEDLRLDELRKGSDNTIKLTKGGDFKYVELTGTGPKAARELATEMKDMILELVQVVLPPPNGGNVPQTLGQVERLFSSMLAKAGMLRKQYGRAAIHLLGMILKAARKLSQGITLPTGQVMKMQVKLTPRIVENDDGTVEVTARKLGSGGQLKLLWPKFFDYTADDVAKATTAAGEAKEKGLIDQRHASEFVADMYRVSNVPDMLAKIKSEAKEAADAMGGGGGAPMEAYPQE